jgi:effector-binding domain-containing protein
MKTKSEDIFLLVKTLSKAEKRYFRLFSNLQKGDKAYVFLFELYDELLSQEEAHEKFHKVHPQKSVEMASKHLYKTIMEILLKLRENQNVQITIFNTISKAEILFERELWNNAFFELNKAKQLARHFENDPLLLLTQSTELKYLSMLRFEGINERKLVGKQMKMNETMKHLRNTNQHLQLYDILKYRITYQGDIRSDKQKEDLNDLALSELHLTTNNTYDGFEAQKLHLLFQATYYLHAGNYKSAIRYYQELITLFEENKHLILNPPIYYFSSIIGVLDSLHTVGLFSEIPFFLLKLKEIEQGNYPVDFISNVSATIFIYETTCLLHTGHFLDASGLLDTYGESLFKKNSSQSYDIQLKLLLQTAIIYFSIGDLNQAKKSMKKIFSMGKLFYSLPSYKIVRLVNLLLQAELNEYDFFQNEISSIKRSMRYEKQNYRTEKLIFKFVQSYPLPSYEKLRIDQWKQFQKEILLINQSKYERQLLKIFDFPSWIESKLTKRNFEELLKEKAK